MSQEGDERYTDTLCAESPDPAGSSACEVASAGDVACRYKVTSSTSGAVGYRVKFSTSNPGKFNENTLKSACTTLSNAIATQTGSDPKLKPLCNHMSTGTAYCDYDSARFHGSYMTQCSESASDVTKCAGFPYDAVTYGVYFNTPNWNGQSHLGLFGQKRHQWVAMNQEDDERYTDTLCVTYPDPTGSSACEVATAGDVACRYKVTSSTTNVVAYRIKYSIQNPGYYNDTSLKSACTTLSTAIAAQTGTDLKLKPICNHMSTGTAYCDYDTAFFTGSYMTQCSASPNDATKCAGYPYDAVTYGIYFNTPNWNGATHLGLFDEKRHQWVAMLQEGDERYTDTLCAATNNYCPTCQECGVSWPTGFFNSGLRISCRHKVTSTTTGQVAYRINFNVDKPGFFDSETLPKACARLGVALGKTLKPVCNHPSYTDGQCTSFSGSYMTQCDPSTQASNCAGFPYESMVFSVFYNTENWNGKNYLGLFGEKHHQWVAMSREGDERYTDTLCA